MCRWPNGDVSFVFARNKEEATIALDEFDNAELATLSKLDSFMLDFRLGDDGDLVLHGFGEECQSEIFARAYPILVKTTRVLDLSCSAASPGNVL